MFSDIFEIERAWRAPDADAPTPRAAAPAADLPVHADAPSIASDLPERDSGWLAQLTARLRGRTREAAT